MAATIPGRYSFGTTPASADQALEICLVMEAELLAFQNSQSQFPWSVIADLGGTYEKIIRSVGDPTQGPSQKGDTRFYVHLERVSTTGIRPEACLDADSTGAVRNQANTPINLASAVTQCSWYASINEYEAFFVWEQGGVWRSALFGQPARTHLHASNRGRAFSTSAVLSGANVQIPVDRDLTAELVVGGKVWIVPLTPDAGSLPGTFLPEFTFISAVTSTYVEVTALANNQPTHCLIGEDPIPSFSGTATTSASFCQEIGGGSAGAQLWDIRPARLDGSETARDPSAIGKFYGMRAQPARVTAGSAGIRGLLHNLHFWTQGSQVETDRNRHNWIDERTWQPFPGLGLFNGMTRCMETEGA